MGKHTYRTTEDRFLRLLGERIQKYRVSKSNTQEQLADSIGSNSSYISKVENGQAEGLTIQMVRSIAKGLGITPAELLDVEDETSSPDSEKRLKRLLRKTLELSDQHRAFALNAIEGMLDGLSKTRSHSS